MLKQQTFANIRAEYEELEENQEELANPVDNEEQIEELASDLEENEEEQIEENQVEVASNPSVANVSSLLGDMEGSENGHASICLLYTSPSPRDGW